MTVSFRVFSIGKRVCWFPLAPAIACGSYRAPPAPFDPDRRQQSGRIAAVWPFDYTLPKHLSRPFFVRRFNFVQACLAQSEINEPIVLRKIQLTWFSSIV